MAKNKQNSKKTRFQNAIRCSLEKLIASGEKITKAAVIANARHESGDPVGQTTLYSKHEVTGNFVHADLLKEITDAAEVYRKKKTGKTKGESMVGLRAEIRGLKVENQKHVDQLVEQEVRLTESESASASSSNTKSMQETELYVLAKTVCELTNNAVNEFKELVMKYDVKYRGDERLLMANQEVSDYLADIKCSKLISLNDITKLKEVNN